MRRIIFAVCTLSCIGFFVHLQVLDSVNARVYARELTFVDDSRATVLAELREEAVRGATVASTESPPEFPFEEVEAFDEDALSWSNMFSQYGGCGALAFDANGDGRQDLYFSQDSQNWTRPTDANGVLSDGPRFQHNGLYLNQGNDERGTPLFKSVGELARANSSHVRAELLVEDYLVPRESTNDTEERLGRSSNVAVAADFDGDGRLDLLVGNEPQGMFWSHEKTQRVLMQFINPVGREAKKSKQPLAAMGLSLIHYTPRNSLQDERTSQRGVEFEGANSLYLNRGDADGDGLPEWEDVSRTSGIEGFRPTYSFSVADVDLDGDLDVFVGNTCDMDYWIGGSKYWAGGANCLYINQLSETGELSFIERAEEMDIDGVYDEGYPMPDYYKLYRIPLLALEYSVWLSRYVAYKPEYLSINGQEGEHGQISWSTVFQDVNNDGFPDIWVANDMGYLRLYLNEEGRRFKRAEHARSGRSGYWMSMAAADFNGDLEEDLFAGNLGGAVMNHAFATPNPYDLFDPVILNATIFAQFFGDNHSTRHALIDGADAERELDNRVQHSSVLPPDVSLAGNYRRHAPPGQKLPPFDQKSLDPYEFSWGAMSFDVQNDGLWDLYFVGCLYGRGGGLFPIAGTNPGRLLINRGTESSEVQFADRTAEHRLFDIEELHYDKLAEEGFVYRKSPSQNWGKRDVVYSYDRSSWSLHGPGVQEKITNHDLIQTAENGRAVVSSDLNGDGFSDVVVRNMGGYDSRSSTAVNLKTSVSGKGGGRVLPAPNYNYPQPTNFEPGSTRLFLNRYSANNWIKLKLLNDSEGDYNLNAIGARVVVNGRVTRTLRSGQGGFLSNVAEPLCIGLGEDHLERVEVHWPDRNRTVTKLDSLDYMNRTLTISKTRGLLE